MTPDPLQRAREITEAASQQDWKVAGQEPAPGVPEATVCQLEYGSEGELLAEFWAANQEQNARHAALYDPPTALLYNDVVEAANTNRWRLARACEYQRSATHLDEATDKGRTCLEISYQFPCDVCRYVGPVAASLDALTTRLKEKLP